MRKLLLFTILFVFALSLTNSVYACSPVAQIAIIKCDIEDSFFQQNTTCLNDDCSVNVSKNQYGTVHLNLQDSRDQIQIIERDYLYGILFSESYLREEIQNHQELFSYLDAVCVENLNDIKPIFSQEIQYWMSTKKGNFLGGNLIFEPYSSDRESELIESKNAYGKCDYEDFKKVGNWFVVTRTSRDYCYLTPGSTTCPRETISYTKFFGFLLSNLNSNTVPYLAVYLITFGIIIGLLVYLFKRKYKNKISN